MVQTKAREGRGRSLARKREILREASKAFREKGFHATGMRDIAARLGVTVGSLYYYFRNKEELLTFCQEDTLRRLEQYVAWVDGLGLGPEARLHTLITAHVACLNEGSRGSLAHLEIPESDTPENRALLARRDDYRRRLATIIDEGVAAGRFGPADRDLAVMAILGAVNWTVRWFRPDGDRSSREIGAGFADQLVGGLLAEGVSIQLPDLDWPGYESLDLDKGTDDA